MSDGHHPIRWQEADPIMEAVDALKASGRTVEPWGEDVLLWLVDGMLWLVEGETLTDGDLLALAMRLGLMDSSTDKLQ